MSQIKLSEIRAHYEGMSARDTGAFYLLRLVERMGKWVAKVSSNDCACLFCQEARALLEELKQ